MLRGFAARGRPSWARIMLSAVVAAACVTLLALFPHHVGVATAALAYVLAVATAAAIGGLPAGIVASVLSFAALHYFFTPPRYVLFQLPATQDLTALVTFLVVSVLVGAMLSTAVSHRQQAERRTAEARILHVAATRLLAGEDIRPVLQGFAEAVVKLLALAAIEVTTVHTLEPIVVGDPAALDRQAASVSMTVRGRQIGSLRAIRPGAEIGPEEQEVLTSIADQLALALDTVELAGQVREAQVEAEASKARAALFSSVTHDLRTPLASILASATTLRAQSQMSPDDRAELVEAICDEATRLNRLVGNLLDLSRARAGVLRPAKVLVPVDELVAGVLGRMERELSAHRVVARVPPDLPEVPMDLVQLDQVLTNLVENAARFAPPGSAITIAADRRDDRIRLAVTDEGPGIPADEREQVFEPFVRGRAAVGAGAGLGLAICRAIAEAHGGTIRFHDRPSPGTSMIVELPLEGG